MREASAVDTALIDAARAALLETTPEDTVGEVTGLDEPSEGVVDVHFATTLPGYPGWTWTVSVSLTDGPRNPSVLELGLLPGEGALVAPEWVPWSERLRPGDLGVGDLLPTAPDDDRLVPAYVLSDDPAVEDVAFELGLGRPRVMSRLGREETAERWYAGDGGPDTPMAAHAPGRCGTCGFWLPLEGSLRGLFGACGNEFSPRDSQVVSADSSCGAHSEALVEAAPPEPAPAPSYDDAMLEVEPHVVESGPADTTEDAESLGHS